METPTNNEKPKWLKELETQSWQAELLISGATIFGLFKLPNLLAISIERLTVNVTEFDAYFLHFIILYLLAGIYALVIFFSIHFFLRGLWIALLGLNSVYPEGIVVNSDFIMSEDYLKRVKKEFPDINQLINKLDRAGSLMFSTAFSVVMMFITISFGVFISGVILKIINYFYPGIESHLSIILVVLYFVVSGPSLLFILLQKVKIFDSQKIADLQFKNTKFLNKLLYNVFYQPMMYISNTLSTNNKFKYKYISMFGLMILAGVLLSVKMNSLQNLKNLEIEDYFTFNQQKNLILHNNYRDMWADDELIYAPSIQSKIIKEPYLELFLPSVKREKAAMEKLYSRVRIKGALHVRDSLRNIQLSNYQKFNKILVNDLHYQNVEFDKIVMGNQQTEGLIAYLPLDQINEGKNTLIVEKQYFSKDSIQKRSIIPFYYSKQK